ncbi:NUDIX domain-containing protein [Actinoplanes sp. NPDC026619]|uniref:NUDIX hydrolase n=1 Tax=Actinoplanes sp. NPDC026619 TaxID=3155798 RepID=UPI0033CBD0AC
MTPLHPVDLHLLLTRGDQVLMALRANTGYADGQWNLPSGKLEPGEDALTGMIREAREEIGLRLHPSELRLASTVHQRNPSGSTRIGLVFAAPHDPAGHGTPANAEPHKCAAINWFPLTGLPPDTVPYTAACIEAFRAGVPFALNGFPR